MKFMLIWVELLLYMIQIVNYFALWRERCRINVIMSLFPYTLNASQDSFKKLCGCFTFLFCTARKKFKCKLNLVLKIDVLSDNIWISLFQSYKFNVNFCNMIKFWNKISIFFLFFLALYLLLISLINRVYYCRNPEFNFFSLPPIIKFLEIFLILVFFSLF